MQRVKYNWRLCQKISGSKFEEKTHYSRNWNPSLSSFLPSSSFSTPFRKQGKHNPSDFLFCLAPSRESSICFVCFLSPFRALSSSQSRIPFFLLYSLWKSRFSACLSGATQQMKWHTVRGERWKKRHFVAGPETEFPWRLPPRCNTRRSGTGRWSAAAFGYTRWLCTVTSLSGGNKLKPLFHYISRLSVTKVYDYYCFCRECYQRSLEQPHEGLRCYLDSFYHLERRLSNLFRSNQTTVFT